MKGQIRERLAQIAMLNKGLIPADQAEDIIHDAEQEFPKLWMDNSDSKLTERRTVVEILKWFVKHFGGEQE